MPAKSEEEKASGRVSVISAVKTYLGFFVLVALVVEAALGALALKATGHIQLVAGYGMVFIIVALILVVAFFAYRKPEALLGSVAGQQQLQEFSKAIAGNWWQRIRPEEPSALSFAEITLDPVTNTVRIKGSAYGRAGDEISAIWETVATCINPNERKVFYYWKGWLPSRPTESYEGFGEISFHESNERIDSGVGFLSNTNLTDMKSTTRKSTEFRRSEPHEDQVMKEGERRLISELIQKKLGTGR